MKEKGADGSGYVESFEGKSFHELRDLELAVQAEMMNRVKAVLTLIFDGRALGNVKDFLLPQSLQFGEDGLVYCVCPWAKGVDADKMAAARKVLSEVGVMLMGPQGMGFGVEIVAVPLEFFDGRAELDGFADAVEGVAGEARGLANEVAAGGAAASRLFEERRIVDGSSAADQAGVRGVPQTGYGDGEPAEGDFGPGEEPPDDF